MNFPVKIDIKPLSVNEAWKGRRFKTDKYKQYEYALLFLLPKIILPDPPFEVFYCFGVSNMAQDVDGPIKNFQDILQKKYGFNDREVYKITALKEKVEKGKEFVCFDIQHYAGAH